MQIGGGVYWQVGLALLPSLRQGQKSSQIAKKLVDFFLFNLYNGLINQGGVYMSNEKDATNLPRYKSKTHLVELYTDSELWNNAYDKLLHMDNVAYIHHNADNCKEHIHAVICTDNQTYNTSIAKQLGVEIKWIQQVKDRNAILRYLIHLDNPDKHQYQEEEVLFTSKYMEDLFKTACNVGIKESEDSKILRLLDMLDGMNERLSYTQFVRLSCENGLYDVVRRSNYLMCKILDEHNNKISITERN